jgi:hypothetical protein
VKKCLDAPLSAMDGTGDDLVGMRSWLLLDGETIAGGSVRSTWVTKRDLSQMSYEIMAADG